MRMELTRDGIEIVPETLPDELYIERVLGLARNGQSIHLRRVGIKSGDREFVAKLVAEGRGSWRR